MKNKHVYTTNNILIVTIFLDKDVGAHMSPDLNLDGHMTRVCSNNIAIVTYV